MFRGRAVLRRVLFDRDRRQWNGKINFGLTIRYGILFLYLLSFAVIPTAFLRFQNINVLITARASSISILCLSMTGASNIPNFSKNIEVSCRTFKINGNESRACRHNFSDAKVPVDHLCMPPLVVKFYMSL